VPPKPFGPTSEDSRRKCGSGKRESLKKLRRALTVSHDVPKRTKNLYESPLGKATGLAKDAHRPNGFHPRSLDQSCAIKDIGLGKGGGVLVSTWEMRQRRHAEDDPLASLIIGSKVNC